MNKWETIGKIRSSRIVAIVRERDPEVAYRVAMACAEGGLECIEVALTTPLGLDVIESLAKEPRLTVGAGTVLDAETAKSAIAAGASFLLSPAVDADVIRTGSRHGVVTVPGALSPTEVVAALQAGADIVKVFPADLLGPRHVQSMAAPLPQAVFLPSGGVDLDNFRDWFVPGVIGVGVGGALASTALQGDYAAIAGKARRFAEAARAM